MPESAQEAHLKATNGNRVWALSTKIFKVIMQIFCPVSEKRQSSPCSPSGMGWPAGAAAGHWISAEASLRKWAQKSDSWAGLANCSSFPCLCSPHTISWGSTMGIILRTPVTTRVKLKPQEAVYICITLKDLDDVVNTRFGKLPADFHDGSWWYTLHTISNGGTFPPPPKIHVDAHGLGQAHSGWGPVHIQAYLAISWGICIHVCLYHT